MEYFIVFFQNKDSEYIFSQKHFGNRSQRDSFFTKMACVREIFWENDKSLRKKFW